MDNAAQRIVDRYETYTGHTSTGFPRVFRTPLDIDKARPIIAVEKFIRTLGAKFKLLDRDVTGEGGTYTSKNDTISIPFFTEFKTSNLYYMVMFHELIHWTGHWRRTGRLKPSKPNSRAYYTEEAIAQLGAVALLERHGLLTARIYWHSQIYIYGNIREATNEHWMLGRDGGMALKRAYELTRQALDYIDLKGSTNEKTNSIRRVGIGKAARSKGVERDSNRSSYRDIVLSR